MVVGGSGRSLEVVPEGDAFGNLRFCVGLPKVPLVAIRGNSLRVCLTKGRVLASMILAGGCCKADVEVRGGGESMEAAEVSS